MTEHLRPSTLPPPPLQVTMDIELVETTPNRIVPVTTNSFTSHFHKTFGRALHDFEKLMGQDHKHIMFESSEAVMKVLHETVKQFNDFRDGDHGLKTWLESYAHLLFTVSEHWESEIIHAVSPTHDSLLLCYYILTSLSHQHHSPEKAISNAIVVLIEVSLFQKLHPRVPVVTITIPRLLWKSKRATSPLWIFSTVINSTFNASTNITSSPPKPRKRYCS
jgi:hypothetical protein